MLVVNLKNITYLFIKHVYDSWAIDFDSWVIDLVNTSKIPLYILIEYLTNVCWSSEYKSWLAANGAPSTEACSWTALSTSRHERIVWGLSDNDRRTFANVGLRLLSGCLKGSGHVIGMCGCECVELAYQQCIISW